MSAKAPNRFVRAIRSGEIDSVDDLKTAFRELALATHPDIGPSAGEGAAEAFIAVRSEYEAALANFERHRFGASFRGQGGGATNSAGGAGRPADVAASELWACLSLFLKRGFPKEARHEKEILRYEYARWRLRGALEALGRDRRRDDRAGPAALFDAFEAELIVIKNTYPGSLSSALAFLRDLLAQATDGHPAMRVALVRELDRLRLAPGFGESSLDFLLFLAGELGIGPTIAAQPSPLVSLAASARAKRPRPS